MRVIFKLPTLYGIQARHPLVYLEWCTPFRERDSLTGFFTVTKSSRMHRVHAEIVEASRLVRNCHLMPKFGRVKDPSWTAENVADLCRTFYVNSYIDYHMYCLFKLMYNGCIANG